MAESRKRAILGSVTVDVDQIAAGATAETTATVGGARPGMLAVASAPSAEAGLMVNAFVSDNDEVTIRVANVTAAPVDPAEQEFLVAVLA